MADGDCAELGRTKDNKEDDSCERGGQITIFSKQDCPYCVRVKKTLEECVEKVLKENPNGSFSVPHVFFNQEYIGDCSSTCAYCSEQNTEKNIIMKKLKSIADGPRLDPPFPPPADATMTKITDDIACSSQPTERQLEKLFSSFGMRSVLNLSSSIESSFFKGEGDLLQRSQPDFQYVHSPLVDLSPQSVSRIMDEATTLAKPVLIHCDTGQRALLVSLLIATEKEENLEESNFVSWGEELGVNLKQLAKTAILALEWRKTQGEAKKVALCPFLSKQELGSSRSDDYESIKKPKVASAEG